MKIIRFLSYLGLILLFAACAPQSGVPRAEHVILIGLDGMGAYDFQRASTPFMNELAKNGALSVKSRCVLESSSSQNWMTMLTGAMPIQHGVTSNAWQPDNHVIEPSLKNKAGFFPSLFDHIKSQKPGSKVYMFYEWDGLGRMFDLSVPDRVVTDKDGKKLTDDAIHSFFVEKPDFLFIGIDETDHIGHVYGHESQEFYDCISKYDSIIGKLAGRLEKEKMWDNTVLIITADHGGLGKSHGGETPYEMEIPVLLSGGKVTRGKVMEQVHTIADIAPTVAGLLGIKMPEECSGKFIHSAFEPATDAQYAPVPLIMPGSGFSGKPVEVTIQADSPDAQLFFTTDNSEPTAASHRYEKPLLLHKTTAVKAVTKVGNSLSRTMEVNLRIAGETDVPAVYYKFYDDYPGITVPDFKMLGKPDLEGCLYEFSLQELKLNNKDHFAIEFTSCLIIQNPGEYRFTVDSDDGVKLYIDKILVADNDGSHSRQISRGKIFLKPGMHEISAGYFDDTDSEFLQIFIESDSLPKQIIPFSMLKRCNAKSVSGI